MEPDIENMLREARRAGELPAEEKTAVKRELLAFMASYEPRRPVLTRAFSLLSARPVFAGAVAAVMLAAGGLAGARTALPGQLLYPLKVAVLEGLPRVWNRTDLARAKWESLVAERRLSEAEVLASSGVLDIETASAMARSIEDSAARIEQWASRTEREQRELAVVNDTLVRIRALTNEQTIARIKIQTAKADADIAATAQDTALAAAVKLARVREGFRQRHPATGTPPAKEAIRIETNLRIAERALSNGSAKLEAKNSREAIVLFEEAFRIAETAEGLLGTSTPPINGTTIPPHGEN